ncbi:MAG: zinc ribbon domain-containing protein [Candidatus Competibacteraceae bacterium]|nr:zinc ribbon domain-containing protein [Candidatus Competibacteraceae bacterium]
MPIYEYRCQSCGHELEVLQKISAALLTDCPACQQPELKKQISAAAFRLKGGGWYETDFKSNNKRNLAEGGESKTEAKAETKTEGKTEAKSEAKSEAKGEAKVTKTESKPATAA